MSKETFLIKLARLIAPENSKSWLDDMADEMNFVPKNKLAWQIGALNFAIQQRFLSINFRSAPNIAIASFAVMAIFALVFVLPYKTSLVSPVKKTDAMLSLPAPAPQVAAAPDRTDISARPDTELRQRVKGESARAKSPQATQTSPEPSQEVANVIADVQLEEPAEETVSQENSADTANSNLKTSPPPSPSTNGINNDNEPDLAAAELSNSAGTRESSEPVGPAGPRAPATAPIVNETTKYTATTAIATNQILSNELIAENLRQISLKQPEFSLKAKEDASLKIYAGLKADENNLLINRIIKKGETLTLKTPVYLEVDNESNILIDNNAISSEEKPAVLLIDSK